MFNYSEYIYAVYQNKSFSKAAKSLFISQPALSNIVKKVEDELGVILFDRRTNPIKLTESGKVYIDAIEKIMDIENMTRENLKKIADSKANTITICGPTYFCANIFPDIIDKYSLENPDLQIKIVEIGTGEMEEFLRLDLADIGVCVEELDPKFFTKNNWFVEDLILAVAKSNPINKELENYAIDPREIINSNFKNIEKYVDLQKFKDQKFILLKKGNDLNDRAIKICAEYGFVPSVMIYMDQLQTSYNIAKSGKGVVFIRDGIVSFDDNCDKLCFYRIKSDYAHRNVNLYHLKNKAFSEDEKKFLNFLNNYFYKKA